VETQRALGPDHTIRAGDLWRVIGKEADTDG
jgi:hypothetical protein